MKLQVQVFNTFCFICCLQLVAAKRDIKNLEQRIASSELKHSAAMEALQQPPATDAEKQTLRAQVEELRAAALANQREIGRLEGQVEVYKVVVLNDCLLEEDYFVGSEASPYSSASDVRSTCPASSAPAAVHFSSLLLLPATQRRSQPTLTR